VQGVHALYLVDAVEKDPVSREHLVKVEKAFEVAEAGRHRALVAQEKLREEKATLQGKLDAEKKKTQSLQAENIKLTDEAAQLAEEISRLKLVEESARELTEKVESIPSLVAEAAKSATEQAVEEFKKSAEFVNLLKQQHLKSVSENIKLYRDRGWLNIEKFRADREADKAAAKGAKEKEVAAEKPREAAEVAAEERGGGGTNSAEGAEGIQGAGSTSVPRTPGASEATE
jgi:cell division protein FtsB